MLEHCSCLSCAELCGCVIVYSYSELRLVLASAAAGHRHSQCGPRKMIMCSIILNRNYLIIYYIIDHCPWLRCVEVRTVSVCVYLYSDLSLTTTAAGHSQCGPRLMCSAGLLISTFKYLWVMGAAGSPNATEY